MGGRRKDDERIVVERVKALCKKNKIKYSSELTNVDDVESLNAAWYRFGLQFILISLNKPGRGRRRGITPASLAENQQLRRIKQAVDLEVGPHVDDEDIELLRQRSKNAFLVALNIELKKSPADHEDALRKRLRSLWIEKYSKSLYGIVAYQIAVTRPDASGPSSKTVSLRKRNKRDLISKPN